MAKKQVLHHKGNRLAYASNTNMIEYKVSFAGRGEAQRRWGP